MANSPEIRVVGYLDDGDRLHGHVLSGLPIHNLADLAEILAEAPVADVLSALPSVSSCRRNEVLNALKAHKIAVRTSPGLSDIPNGKVSLIDVRGLDTDDLLGREPVMPNHPLLSKSSIHKVVLVTGAGGLIGSVLCRQILAVGPEKLLFVDMSQFALYAIHQELELRLADKKTILVPLLASALSKTACARSCPPDTRTCSTMPPPTSTCPWWSATRLEVSKTT